MSARRLKPYPAYQDSGVEWLGAIPVHWEVKRVRFVSESNPVPSEVRGLPGETEEIEGEIHVIEQDILRMLAEVTGGPA